VIDLGEISDSSEAHMTEPTITCPNCKTELKLTESLAAPLLAATRSHYEQRLAQKDAEISTREAAIRQQQAMIAKEKEAIDEKIAEKLVAEREKIAVEEARKARLILATDLDEKAKEAAGLKEVLRQRDAKLAEAQQAQAEAMRRQREIDDARREIDLTIEKRVQESLGAVWEKAKKDAEEGLQLKVREREEQIASMQRRIEDLKRNSKVKRKRSSLRPFFAEDSRGTRLSPLLRVNSEAICCITSLARRDNCAAPSCGKQNGLRLGAMAGSRNSATTSGPRRRTLH
jgi:hypothetical protein